MSKVCDAPRHIQFMCPRCDAVSNQIGHYRRHVARKSLCKPATPAQADVQPTLDNPVKRLLHGPDVLPVLHSTIGDGAHHNTVHNTLHNTIDNSIIDNSTHTHNTTILAFGKEDMSHITPEMMATLVELGAKDGAGAVTGLIMQVHFNLAKPRNMNVYMPATKDGSPEKACVWDGKGWKDESTKCPAVLSMIRDKASDLMTYVEDNVGKVPLAVARDYERFYDSNFMGSEPLRARVRNLAVDSAPLVAACHNGVI